MNCKDGVLMENLGNPAEFKGGGVLSTVENPGVRTQ